MFKLKEKSILSFATMFILIMIFFVPLTLTDFIANNNPCCNGKNIVSINNNSCINDNADTNKFCANSANINDTLCHINLHCGINNTYNEEYRLFETNPLYDLRNDYYGNLIISDFHMFYYDNKMIIPSTG